MSTTQGSSQKRTTEVLSPPTQLAKKMNQQLPENAIDNILQQLSILSVSFSDLRNEMLNSVTSIKSEMISKINEVEQELKNSIDQSCSRSETNKCLIDSLSDEQSRHKTEIDIIKDDLKSLKEENRSLRERGIQNECRQMRNNLIFFGIPEKKKESCLKEVQYVLTKMKIVGSDQILIPRCHRLGLYNQKKVRPIIAYFESYSDRY
jgi:PP-loop superfamily ATP-utilizing enzyme